MPYEVIKKDSSTGKAISVNNPKIINALKDFAKIYKEA